MPASAAGPTCASSSWAARARSGVITRSALRSARDRRPVRYEGFAFASFGEGAEAMRCSSSRRRADVAG
jgi:hypothetical protein